MLHMMALGYGILARRFGLHVGWLDTTKEAVRLALERLGVSRIYTLLICNAIRSIPTSETWCAWLVGGCGMCLARDFE